MVRRFSAVLLVVSFSFAACKKASLPTFKQDPEVKPQPAPVVEQPKVEPVPQPEKPKTIDTKGSVIVLCYHRFEETPKDSLGIKPSVFESQMQEIKNNGFTVIGMQDFLAWRRGEKSIPEKSCVITIDDGYRSGYDIAWPILKKHGYPFTMFIYTAFVKGGALAGGASLSWAELEKMRDEGVDIQSHTANHQNLKVKTGKFQAKFPNYQEWLKSELEGSRRELEKRLGISVKALAYPYGNHNEEIRTIAMQSGYEAAFSVYGQRLTYHSPADQLGRYAIESTKPKIFTDAMAMVGGGGGTAETSGGNTVTQLAASSMVTIPHEGEVVKESKPLIKANLATLGDVEPTTLEMRVSGVGSVPVKYDPATKTVTGTILQPLKDKQVTVILVAYVGGRRVETRWSFQYEPTGSGR